MREHLRVGEAASLLGVNPKTIRYYEELGIVRPGRVANGYRSFSEGDLARLRFTFRAKKLGLTLSEIKTLLEFAGDGRCANVRASARRLVMGKIAQTTERIQELSGFKKELEVFLSGGREADLASGSGDCVCLDR